MLGWPVYWPSCSGGTIPTSTVLPSPLLAVSSGEFTLSHSHSLFSFSGSHTLILRFPYSHSPVPILLLHPFSHSHTLAPCSYIIPYFCSHTAIHWQTTPESSQHQLYLEMMSYQGDHYIIIHCTCIHVHYVHVYTMCICYMYSNITYKCILMYTLYFVCSIIFSFVEYLFVLCST